MGDHTTGRLAWVIAALSIAWSVEGGILASGTLNSCVNDGSAPETSLQCSKKLLVTLELSNNKKYETERLDFEVSCVNSPTNECPCPCDYASDAGCTCRNLAQKLSVGVTKTAVYASYPLTYVKKFNGRPSEGIIMTTGGTCKDGDYDAAPTCGWARAPNIAGVVQNIPASQGFCCTCSASDSLGGGSTTLRRGNVQCSLEDLINPDGSAHCLRYDDWWWYAGYRIGPYQLDFSIALNLTTTTTTNQQPQAQPPSNSTAPSPPPASSPSPAASTGMVVQREVLTLTPSKPVAVDSSRSLSAKLLGDLEAYAQVPQLMGQYVLVPAPPDRAPGANVLYNKAEWLVVEPGMLTLDGTQCNKIGVGYAAFRNQPSRCSAPPQTCLSSQVFDLLAGDQDRIARGLDPLYLITRYGTGDDNPRQAEYSRSGGAVQLSLNLPLTSIKTSLLTFSVAADDLTFTTNRSPAKILGTRVCTFSGVTCGGFQAMATRGYLTASVQNTGALAADYTVTVAACSAGVMPVLAQAASLAAGEARDFVFELQMEVDGGIANASCMVGVADVVGEEVASAQVVFYANATEYEDPPDQSDIDDDITGPGDQPAFKTCAELCPNLLNLVCTAKNGCWGRLGGALGALSSIPIVLLVLWVAFRRGWLVALVKWLGRKPAPRREGSAGAGAEAGAKRGGSRAAEVTGAAGGDAVVTAAGNEGRHSKRCIHGEKEKEESMAAGSFSLQGAGSAAAVQAAAAGDLAARLHSKQQRARSAPLLSLPCPLRGAVAADVHPSFSMQTNPLAAQGEDDYTDELIHVPVRVHALDQAYPPPSEQAGDAGAAHLAPLSGDTRQGEAAGATAMGGSGELPLRLGGWQQQPLQQQPTAGLGSPVSPMRQAWPPQQWFSLDGIASPQQPIPAAAAAAAAASAAAASVSTPAGYITHGRGPSIPSPWGSAASLDLLLPWQPGASSDARPAPAGGFSQEGPGPQQGGESPEPGASPDRGASASVRRKLSMAPAPAPLPEEQRPASRAALGARPSAAEERLHQWLSQHPMRSSFGRSAELEMGLWAPPAAQPLLPSPTQGPAPSEATSWQPPAASAGAPNQPASRQAREHSQLPLQPGSVPGASGSLAEAGEGGGVAGDGGPGQLTQEEVWHRIVRGQRQ